MFPHLLWDGSLTFAGKRGYSHFDSFLLLDSLPTCKDSIVRVLRENPLRPRSFSNCGKDFLQVPFSGRYRLALADRRLEGQTNLLKVRSDASLYLRVCDVPALARRRPTQN